LAQASSGARQRRGDEAPVVAPAAASPPAATEPAPAAEPQPTTFQSVDAQAAEAPAKVEPLP
jgi:hypothetical protein